MVLAELIILMYAALWWGFASQSAVDYIVQTVGSAPDYFPSAGSRVIWLWLGLGLRLGLVLALVGSGFGRANGK